MRRSNMAGGKKRLTKASPISFQVVITPLFSSLNQNFSSLVRDDGKSLSLMASTLVLSYRKMPQILTNSTMKRISEKSTKIEAKTDKTEHGNEKSIRSQIRAKSQSQKSTPTKSKSKPKP
ncbi:hypothetical protein Tco_0273993 [Tanacetum coccineum]